MFSRFIFTLLFFSFGYTFSQEFEGVIVVFEISDQNGEVLEGVEIDAIQRDVLCKAISDKKGLAILEIKSFGQLKTTFSHEGFSKKTVMKEIPKNIYADTLYFKITLNSLVIFNLKEVEVVAPGVPQIIYSSNKNSIQDFQILDENNIILLASSKRFKKKSKLLLCGPLKSIKDSLYIDQEGLNLVRDYEGNIYLIHKTGSIRIDVNDNKIGVKDISFWYLKKYILPVIGTYGNKMFFSTYDPFYPAFDYYHYDVKDSIYTKFTSVIDEEMMDMYRSEYTFADRLDSLEMRQVMQAKNYEIETGVDAAIYYGRKYFTRTVFYKPAFAPMFQVENKFYLFDYHSESLKEFDEEGLLLSKKSIDHHQNSMKTGWIKLLLQDPISKTIYTVFERRGFYYLSSINLTTGEILRSFKLNNRYAESIQVYNGYIYYVHRPFESHQKKYFWREKLSNR